MNLRLTLTAAAAVILASVSLYPLIQTAAWFWAGVGAVIAAAAAGIITRLPTLPSAVACSLVALMAAGPLLAGPALAQKLAGVLIVAVTAASRPRLRTMQLVACLITYLAALLVYLNLAFAGRLSAAGIVPTRASLSYLSSLVSQGLAERTAVPPVPGGQGIVLLAAAGIGLMAAATDLLAVRLRSPATAGLPLLALYCVRITTSAKQGGLGATVVFFLGMIGYLALLAADGRERLRIWGRLVTVWHNPAAGPGAEPGGSAEAPDTRGLAASGRRIGLAAACIALAVPLLLPGISMHDLFKTQPAADGPGGPPAALPSPLVQMQRQLLNSSPHTALTYQTTARNPQEQYLQVYVLNYDGSAGAWDLVPPTESTAVSSRPLPPAPGVSAGTPQALARTEITLSQGITGYDAKLGFLPLPYAPATVRVPGSWLEDNPTLMVYSNQPQLSGLSYAVTSTSPILDADDLGEGRSYPPGIEASFLSFPAGPHDELATLAAQITKGARTPYQKAVDLQSFFLSGKFSYSVDVNLPDSTAGLVNFLYTAKSGYCQQFAFAMAGLARLAGIPSRIAVGYTAGQREPDGTWKVTTADAHAWPELYFSGIGWVRFEPTPSGADGQGTADPPQYALAPGGGAAATPPAAGPGAGARAAGVNLGHIGRQNADGGGLATSRAARGRGILPWILIIVALAAALGAIAPLTARSVVRRRRLRTAGHAAQAHAAWREARDDLADYGLACRASESPRAFAARAAGTLRLDPPTTEALGRIVSAEERARYAASPLASPPLRADSAAVRQALWQQAGWAGRWRARLLPASMLIKVRTALQHALDIFGWMDAAGLKLRGSGLHGGALHGEGLRGEGLRKVRHQEQE